LKTLTELNTAQISVYFIVNVTQNHNVKENGTVGISL
jgi:hypothetical protein